MKKQDQTVENMIMQAHYLEALEIESKAEKPLADMERQDFINTIMELKAMISSLKLTITNLKLTIDTLRQTISSQNTTIASLQKSMDRLQSAYDKAVKERDDLNGRMNRSNQETFGSKSLKQRGMGKVVKNDRQKERDEWSSKDDNDNDASSTSSPADGEIDQTKVKSENLSRSGRKGKKYNCMNAAKTITLETSLEGAPEDMKFIGYKDIEEYTKKSYVECTVFKVATTLYRIEAECLLNHYTPQQIKKRRQQKDVTKILSLIYKKANRMLTNPNCYHYSDMMLKALVYVTSNWDDLIKYRNDGRFTIDNMLAERAVRPFTVKRKNSLFFSSEDGIELALKYHTLIETCKNVGLNVKEYFTYVFSKLIEGEKDYEKLLPSAVAQ